MYRVASPSTGVSPRSSGSSSRPSALRTPAAAPEPDLMGDDDLNDGIPTVAAPLQPHTTIVIEGCPEPVTIAQLEATLAPSQPLRRGKWTREEEEYADHLIQEFQKGIINIKESTTMRSYLATELHCPAMRISKKYHGNASMGLQLYVMMSLAKRALPETADMIERMKARRQYFRMNFLIKLYQCSLKNRPLRDKPEAPAHHYAIVAPAGPLHHAGGPMFSTMPSNDNVYNGDGGGNGNGRGSGKSMRTRGASAASTSNGQQGSFSLPEGTSPAPSNMPMMMGGSATPYMLPYGMTPSFGGMLPGTPPGVKVEGTSSAPAPQPFGFPPGMPFIPASNMLPPGSTASAPGGAVISNGVVYIPVIAGMGPPQMNGGAGGFTMIPGGGFSASMMPSMQPMASMPGGEGTTDASFSHARLCAQAAQPVNMLSFATPGSSPFPSIVTTSVMPSPHSSSDGAAPQQPQPQQQQQQQQATAHHFSLTQAAPVFQLSSPIHGGASTITVPTFAQSVPSFPGSLSATPTVQASCDAPAPFPPSTLSDASLLMSMATV